MRKYNEEELKLLTDVLPNVARHLNGAMANVYAAVNRLAPQEERESDAELDRSAAFFLQSYYRMYRVIGNLNDAKLLTEEGRFTTLVNVDVIGFARGVCERAEALFEQQGVTLVFESGKPGQIIALDEGKLERALLNLLSNALKFTPKGGRVTVCVRVTHERVCISVSDTGCGIAPDKLERVFDRFLDVDAMDPEPYGMGLGLALCRRIAQGHGGSIVAESAEGKGSTFIIALPNERATGTAKQTIAVSSGFNETLVQLSDALGASAFTHRYLD